jgi:3-deoxy-D-manno-octulosonic-acid transferase
VWFHCSSLGEFEQAAPVLQELRLLQPRAVRAVTVFSPSGYGGAAASGEADWVGYLPFDTKRNAVSLLDLLRPSALVFMRYDLWPSVLAEARQRGVPVIVASAALNPRSLLAKPLLRRLARFFYGRTTLLAVNEEEATAFRALLGSESAIEVAGDPRVDRVRERCGEPGPRGDNLFSSGSFILAAGSTHLPDERVLVDALVPWPHPSLKVLLVPHDPTERSLAQAERLLAAVGVRSRRWSLLGEEVSDAPVVIVDKVGYLAHLYRGCHIAYVGGGFTAGVHSVLEPAAAGLPVVVGPRVWRSPEARALVARNGAVVVEQSHELASVVRRMREDEASRLRMADACKSFVDEGAGAARTVAKRVAELARG